MNRDNEESLEQATMQLFESLGYEVINAYHEDFGNQSLLGRECVDEVVLVSRLRPALERFNPELPREAIEAAIAEISRDRSLMTMVAANEQIYRLLRDGLKVSFKATDGSEIEERVKFIEWSEAKVHENDFLAVQQLWVLGINGLYKRRADIVLFINGLPLVFIELKTFHRQVENAYNHNLSDYKDTIPHLFWYNAFIILSNGRYSRMGSITATWEHFHEWKRISDEREQGRISLETMLEGTCEKSRLLDVLENFVLFQRIAGGTVKIIARNHQFLGVNNALQAVTTIRENQGRLGVFWHTQGSGKSYSMVFFSEKVRRKLAGNWTFLVVTDREELDQQIYQNFADVGAVPDTKGKRRDVQAASGEELKRLLREDHRYVFTLIQKFHTRNGETYPVLSERQDIIVMTDEAHRSQYDTFAANMRNALPDAAFIGFTGTPLMAGEEKTKQVFGEYVSVYDFKQSVEDGATVPLYYENRIPHLQLTNEELNADMEDLLETAMLDEEQESKLEREFKQEYQIITRESRQVAIAEDILEHYLERGFAGRSYQSKAMVVCIDKLTAVRLYERVRKLWQERITALESERHPSEEQQAKLAFMRETDMTVVISQSQGEVEFFRRHGIDILPIRERMVKERLDDKFKKADDPFRLVFVCAMWMTGFDAPACSTIYLDKPMRNHTLMQTIARANRVFKDKKNGLIVDYIGVFRNLEKALAIYGSGEAGTSSDGIMPVQRKNEQLTQLREKTQEAEAFCEDLGIDLKAIVRADGFERLGLKEDAVEAILLSEESRQRFLLLAQEIKRLYKAILPDKTASEFYFIYKMLNILSQALFEGVDGDISAIEGELGELLDGSVIAETYVIEASPTDESRRVDLSRIDFDALRQRFEAGHRRTATERLRGAINRQLQRMVRQNRTRMDYLETFRQMIEEYNSGAVNVEVIFERLITFVEDLEQEDKRSIAESLSEEELTIFDLLTKPQIELSPEEREQVKRIARELLATLKREKLVIDWRKEQGKRAAVQNTIRIILDAQLPEKYDKPLYDQKCADIYQHIYESYFGSDKSIYSEVA